MTCWCLFLLFLFMGYWFILTKEKVVRTLLHSGQFLSDAICALDSHFHHSMGGISAHSRSFRTNSKNLSLRDADQVLRQTTLWHFVEYQFLLLSRLLSDNDRQVTTFSPHKDLCSGCGPLSSLSLLQARQHRQEMTCQWRPHPQSSRGTCHLTGMPGYTSPVRVPDLPWVYTMVM